MDPCRLGGPPAQDPTLQKVQHRQRPTHPANHRRRKSGPDPMATTKYDRFNHEMTVLNGSLPTHHTPEKQPGTTILPERRRNNPWQPPRTWTRSDLKRGNEELGPCRPERPQLHRTLRKPTTHPGTFPPIRSPPEHRAHRLHVNPDLENDLVQETAQSISTT